MSERLNIDKIIKIVESEAQSTRDIIEKIAQITELLSRPDDDVTPEEKMWLEPYKEDLQYKLKQRKAKEEEFHKRISDLTKDD